MKRQTLHSLLLACATAVAATAMAKEPAPTRKWLTVVNQNDVMPDSATASNPAGRTFNSFNQPSVNANGLVAFRARSRGGPPLGPPTRGIYVRLMSLGEVSGNPIEIVLDANSATSSLVPYPNNLDTTFIEFPSIPRVAITIDAVATRGNHQPVWTYTLPDDTETRVGTTGVYVDLEAWDGVDEAVTGASKLGLVSGFEVFQVPGAIEGTAFDVFPGAPAVTDEGQIAFKGNYTELVAGVPVAKTGVFYRYLSRYPAGGAAPVELIASSDTLIPNLPPGVGKISFGSTAPPSAAAESVVFVGLDVEAAPTYGGIYLAPISQPPLLTALVEIGSKVPGENATFTRLGEGLSFDGRFVGFWGAWATDQPGGTKTLWLDCPTEGNQERIQYCLDEVGDDFPVEVPVNQGIFVSDVETGRIRTVARTGRGTDDFVFWNFSGRVPGDEEDGEPARWRSSAFVAVSRRAGATFLAAFKARTGAIDPSSHAYIDPVDRIFLAKGPGSPRLSTVLSTGMPGPGVDPEAPVDSVVTELGLERDGLRGAWLAVSASMRVPGASEEEGMAGIYATLVR